MTQIPIFRRAAVLGVALIFSVGCAPKATSTATKAPGPQLLTPMDLAALPSLPPDRRIKYGEDSSEYGELRVPSGTGPHPVAVLIHGGCFKAAYATTRDLSAMADALKNQGIATWNVEYRRVGQTGGGWPGTYLDVGNAVDYLRTIAGEYNLDLKRVVLVGHSAGGNLAMWAAGRSRLPMESPVRTADPLPIRGVVNLAGPMDLTANIPGYQALCRDSVITSLMGGTPTAVPDRYAQASAIKLLPLGTPQVVIIGEHEDFVPRPIAASYVDAAIRSGDQARLIVIPGVGHFDIASPRASTWETVSSTIRYLLDGRMPAISHPGR